MHMLENHVNTETFNLILYLSQNQTICIYSRIFLYVV